MASLFPGKEIDRKREKRDIQIVAETGGEYHPLFRFADMNEGGFAIPWLNKDKMSIAKVASFSLGKQHKVHFLIKKQI